MTSKEASMSKIDDLYSDNSELSAADIEAAWKQVCAEHIQPSRIFELALSLVKPTESDEQHLSSCDRCRLVYDQYLADDDQGNFSVECSGEAADPNRRRQQHLPLAIEGGSSGSPVPVLLSENLRAIGPVVFPNDEVAFETWQFGRIEELLHADAPLAESIIDAIVCGTHRVFAQAATRRKKVIVCFGQALHRCGTRLAARLIESGADHLHVVLAHDFYSPTLLCAPKELRGADVTVLVDVVHTGGLLERLFAVCREFAPYSIRGLALIDQSGGKSMSADLRAVWVDQQEARIKLSEFLDNSNAGDRVLTCFEPNLECSIRSHGSEPARPFEHDIADQLVSHDSELVKLIHDSNALKCDYSIGQKHYAYVINVLDFLREASCRERVLHSARKQLDDVTPHDSCLAYHAGRGARAGKLARALGRALHVPVVPIGRRGPLFTLTQQQYRRLRLCKSIVIVDAAIRTGDSLTAIAKAFDSDLFNSRRIIAFCVLDALSNGSCEKLSAHLGIEIRTLYKAPLSPPTEEVRHWASVQRALIREELKNSGMFTDLEPVLREYCSHQSWPSEKEVEQSLAQTRQALEKAISNARVREQPEKQIGIACRTSQASAIRHLPVVEVIHDRSVQGLLMGVMYNSVPPSVKETAVFALAAARNYEWMTYDWLQNNRSFLGSKNDSWKSVLMIECQMKLNNQTAELARFRDALREFAGKLPNQLVPEVQLSQDRLSFDLRRQFVGRASYLGNETEIRIGERVQLLAQVAG